MLGTEKLYLLKNRSCKRATICEYVILPVEYAGVAFSIFSELCGVIGVNIVLTSFRGKSVLAKLLRGESSFGSATVTNNEF